MFSVARCAWCSYKTVADKTATVDDAYRRWIDCIRLKHMTPCEHQLQARDDHGRNGGPVAGFNQYRHMIAGESSPEFDFGILDTVYKDRDFIAG